MKDRRYAFPFWVLRSINWASQLPRMPIKSDLRWPREQRLQEATGHAWKCIFSYLSKIQWIVQFYWAYYLKTLLRFSFSLFISPPYSTVTNDQLLQKKCVLFTGHSLWKCSCTFSQAIMWVSYIQLCVVHLTVCFCAVAWHADWDQMPQSQYAIPTVVYYLQCVCSKWFSLPFPYLFVITQPI